ncbi:MAG: hypothetical protein ABID35_03875 [Candidatus Margulisiibacteriota bacterium]
MGGVVTTLYNSFHIPTSQQGTSPNVATEGVAVDPEYTDRIQLSPGALQEVTAYLDENRDGTVDQDEADNFIGLIDGNAGGNTNGQAEAGELIDEIYSHADNFPQLIADLATNGFENPLQVTEEMYDYVDGLLDRHSGGNSENLTALERAIIIYRAVIAEGQSFTVGNATYEGFSLAEGGLNISYDNSSFADSRITSGNLLPEEVVGIWPDPLSPAEDQPDRYAQCHEFTHLLSGLLRAAGIKANVVLAPSHAYVNASLEGVNYRIDGAQPGNTFSIINGNHVSDVAAMSAHQSHEASIFREQAESLGSSPGSADILTGEALNNYHNALELNPLNANAWLGISNIYRAQGNNATALDYLQRANDLQGDNPSILQSLGEVHEALGNRDVAAGFYFRVNWINEQNNPSPYITIGGN